MLGAYTPIGEGAPVESGAGAIGWHAFDVALLGLGLTVLATAALAARVLAGRDRDPALRAFVAVTLGYVGAARRSRSGCSRPRSSATSPSGT